VLVWKSADSVLPGIAGDGRGLVIVGQEALGSLTPGVVQEHRRGGADTGEEGELHVEVEGVQITMAPTESHDA
jgi:hypothetical protein